MTRPLIEWRGENLGICGMMKASPPFRESLTARQKEDLVEAIHAAFSHGYIMSEMAQLEKRYNENIQVHSNFH